MCAALCLFSRLWITFHRKLCMSVILCCYFRKIPRDLTEASLSGAGLSIIAALAMMFLFGMVKNVLSFLPWFRIFRIYLILFVERLSHMLLHCPVILSNGLYL